MAVHIVDAPTPAAPEPGTTPLTPEIKPPVVQEVKPTPGTPANVIERNLSNIAGPQAIAGRQQKDCVISPAKGGRLIYCG